MIGTSQLINTFSRPCFTDTTDIFKDGSGVALYGLDYDASDAGGTSGKFGEAAIFNGSSSRIDLPSTVVDSIKSNSSFAVSAWFNTSVTGTRQVMFSSLEGTYIIFEVTTGNQLKGIVANSVGTNTVLTIPITVTDGAWHHALFTGENGDLRLYLDNGTPQTSASWNGTFYNGTGGTGIGVRKYYNDSNWNGKLDQVRIYDSALTQSQVTQLYQENSSTVGTHLFGCIANYNLDGSAKESMGTTAYDGTETDITYRYDGTPTAVEFGVGGKSNYGARFNGSSSKIDLNSLSTVLDAQSIVSVSFWFKSSSTALSGLFSYRGSASSAVNMLVTLNRSATGDIGLDSSTSGAFVNLGTYNGTYNDDNWHHVVSTINYSTGAFNVYIDKTLRITGTNTSLSRGTADKVLLGTNYDTQFINGDLDQVRIFSKELSSDEVGKLYGNGAGEIACAYTSTTDNVAYPIANTAYYKLDNNSKDSARSTGKFNEGAVFNGSSSYINLGDPTSGITTANYSISFWVNTTSTSASYLISKYLTDGVDSTDVFRAMNLSNGTIDIRISLSSGGSARDITSTSTINDGNWHHILFTVEPNLSKLYINGAEEGSSTTGTAKAPSSVSRNVTIGRHDAGDNYFNGSIDQVRIYNTALDSTDASNLHAETVSDTSTLSFPSGKTAIATYQLDGNSTDLSGNYNGTDTNVAYAYDGTETNIEYRFGRYGQAAVFNGSSSKILPTSSPIPSSGAFTVSAWVKTSVSNHCFISFGDFWLKAEYLSGVFSLGDINTSFQGTTDISDGSWHHCVLTVDNSNNIALYVDGTSEDTGTSTISRTNGGSFVIGVARNSSPVYYFNGSIDQVRIYSTALTSSQVTELYEEKPCADTSNFKTVLYEGNGGTQYISNVGFDLDADNGGDGGLVWVKNRDFAVNHYLYDSIRGTGAAKALHSNTTDSETSASAYSVNGGVESFDANGFFAFKGSDGTYQGTNKSGQDYVAWVWKGGGDDVLNEEGTIDSQVSANTEAGFSIVKYTGNGTTGATFGHGLDEIPQLMLSKRTDTDDNWNVYTQGTGNTGILYLNLTDAFTTVSNRFNNTSPTSDVFTLGNSPAINANNGDYIAYCFHSVTGYSKIGSYPGTGANGNSIFTGFEPAFVMVKRTNAADNWVIVDSKRGLNESLFADLSSQELNNSGAISFESNGFTVNGASGGWNNGSSTYIYMAFK